jgi:hypothetical protein
MYSLCRVLSLSAPLMLLCAPTIPPVFAFPLVAKQSRSAYHSGPSTATPTRGNLDFRPLSFVSPHQLFMSDSDTGTEEKTVNETEETAVALPTPTSQSSATYYDDEVSIYLLPLNLRF